MAAPITTPNHKTTELALIRDIAEAAKDYDLSSPALGTGNGVKPDH